MHGSPRRRGRGARLGRLRGAAPAAVGQQAVDDGDVQRQDRHRQDREAGIQSVCRMVLTLAQATPNQRPQDAPRQIANAAKNCSDAEGEQEPAPGVEVAEDVPGVGDEDVRPVDRGDPVERVQDRGDRDHHAGERDQPLVRSRLRGRTSPSRRAAGPGRVHRVWMPLTRPPVGVGTS